MTPYRILVTGGGTGGHVSPAIAVIQTLRERHEADPEFPEPVFRYVGSESGIEAKLAREIGVEFVGVATGKLRRSSRGALGLITGSNARDALRVPAGIAQSIGAVRSFRPDVLLATGGYVSVPPVIAAWMCRVPVLIHEQTVTVGLANRIAGRFADKIALTFEGSLDDLPGALRSKTIVTGNPVRSAIFQGRRESAVRRFFPDAAASDDSLPCVYVTGGAQGARVLNRAVQNALPNLLSSLRIVHQCGSQPEGSPQDFDALTQAAGALPAALQARYHVTRFVNADAVGDAYALADLVVARSGAGTVAEVCALGKPALFVPLVPTGGDEQTRNARRSVDVGAAAIVPQAECDGPRLQSEILGVLTEPQRLQSMGAAALTLATPNAAASIADALITLTKAHPKTRQD